MFLEKLQLKLQKFITYSYIITFFGNLIIVNSVSSMVLGKLTELKAVIARNKLVRYS
jgi:hypothetical protein